MAVTKEPPLAHYLDRELTKTQRRYLDWAREQTGHPFEDEKGFMLAVLLRDQFAKSPENQKIVGARKEELRVAREAVEAYRAQQEEAAKAERRAKRQGGGGKAKAAATPASTPPAAKRGAAKTPAPAPEDPDDDEFLDPEGDDDDELAEAAAGGPAPY